MRTFGWICCIAALAVATGCEVRKVGNRRNQSAQTAGPQFANLCIAQSDWPRLLSAMRTFGTKHHLEMHGGIDSDGPQGPMLNAYLAQGYSYYFGDDFDLWFVSDPFRKDVVTLGGVLKRKPITAEQQALARLFCPICQALPEERAARGIIRCVRKGELTSAFHPKQTVRKASEIGFPVPASSSRNGGAALSIRRKSARRTEIRSHQKRRCP